VLLDESQAAVLDEQAPDTGGSGKASGPSLREPTAAGVAFGARRGLTGEPAFYGGEKGGASRFFPTFRYEAKAPGSERPEVDGVAHATVKPLDLMRWLVRLVTRRGGHVLDPFAGSGTTGEAALLEGMDSTLIELESDHLPLILQRVHKPLQPSMFGDWDGDAA
jgi:site-specific DNA-methyltransferase (adenine-specific)